MDGNARSQILDSIAELLSKSRRMLRHGKVREAEMAAREAIKLRLELARVDQPEQRANG
jgi:hypothetical protein